MVNFAPIIPVMQKLRAWLELTGEKPARLAKLIGVSRNTIVNWSKGRTEPNGVQLRKLHEVTRIALDDLVPKDNETA